MSTWMDTREKVFAYMEEHRMLQPGDRVVAGVSGGADSVCLLFLLLEWRKVHPLEIAVVHVNHGIRAEASEDAAYVERLCREQNLPFYLTEADVRARAEREKCSEEEAGRRTRYEAFAQAARKLSGAKIAVAHNSNDRSETQLFHLFRGSGIRGLASILPVRGEIIRPLLCLERREIEDALRERGIAYCTDATNAEDDYTRNRIRHHILPYAEENIVHGCVAHMNQTAELLAETEDYLEEQTAAAAAECLRREASGEVRIGVAAFQKLHLVIQKRLLYEEVRRLAPGQRDITYRHIGELLTLFTREGNRAICLPFGIRGRREYGEVVIGTDSGEVQVVSDPGTLEYTILDALEVREKNQEVPTNQYTKWLDYDKIKKCPVIRTRQPGDYLTISDGKGGMVHKSLKSYLIDQKIPKTERDHLMLLAEDDHILWVVGYRISEYYKITENTKRILKVQLVRKEFA